MSVWTVLALTVAFYLVLKIVVGGFKPRYPSENLITGGQPRPKDLEGLKEQGCTTVVNMRGAHERCGFDERAHVENLGMTYHHVPVSGASDINITTAKALNNVLKKSKGKALVHCASGNRVGAVMALYAHKHLGMNADDAMAFGRRAGLGAMAPLVRAQLK